MIIRPRPRGRQLLYIRRGSIVPAIAPRVLAIGGLAVDAMVRTIEIDVLDALGERPLPEPLQPQGYLLQ